MKPSIQKDAKLPKISDAGFSVKNSMVAAAEQCSRMGRHSSMPFHRGLDISLIMFLD